MGPEDAKFGKQNCFNCKSESPELIPKHILALAPASTLCRQNEQKERKEKKKNKTLTNSMKTAKLIVQSANFKLLPIE